MLSDISGKWLLLDAEGIMLSDISGKWLLLDADGMTQHDAVIIKKHAFS
jgi:glucan-binding YG repeat protein